MRLPPVIISVIHIGHLSNARVIIVRYTTPLSNAPLRGLLKKKIISVRIQDDFLNQDVLCPPQLIDK